MALTLNVLSMGREPGNDGVIIVVYVASKIIGGKYYRRFGSCPFTPAPTDPAFVPFAELTEAAVVQWLQDTLDPDVLARIEDQLNTAPGEVGTEPLSYGSPW
jgi:hypothetical protein